MSYLDAGYNQYIEKQITDTSPLDVDFSDYDFDSRFESMDSTRLTPTGTMISSGGNLQINFDEETITLKKGNGSVVLGGDDIFTFKDEDGVTLLDKTGLAMFNSGLFKWDVAVGPDSRYSVVGDSVWNDIPQLNLSFSIDRDSYGIIYSTVRYFKGTSESAAHFRIIDNGEPVRYSAGANTSNSGGTTFVRYQTSAFTAQMMYMEEFSAGTHNLQVQALRNPSTDALTIYSAKVQDYVTNYLKYLIFLN